MLAIKARALRVETAPYDDGTPGVFPDSGGAGAEESRPEEDSREIPFPAEAYASFAFRKNHIRCEYPWNEADDYDYDGNPLARGFLRDCNTDSFIAALQTGSLRFFRPDGTEIPREEISGIRVEKSGPGPEDCAPAFEVSGRTSYGRVYDPETTRKSRASYEANEAFFSALRERQVPPSWLTEIFFPELLACGSGEERDAARSRAAEEIRRKFPPKGREADAHEPEE